MNELGGIAKAVPLNFFGKVKHDKRMSKQKMNDTANTGIKRGKELRINEKIIDIK